MTDTPDDESSASNFAPTIFSRLLLHRVAFDDRKLEALQSHGIEVIKTRSLEEVRAELKKPGAMSLVVDLSSGGAAPEQVFETLKATPRNEPVHLLGCTLRRGHSPARRAEKLGLKHIFLWPEGVFSELVRHLHLGPNAQLSRSAERAHVSRALGRVPGFLRGRILNVSRSGAMVDTDEPLEVGRLVYLMLSLDRRKPPHAIHVRVCWVEKHGKHHRMGLEFVSGLSEEDKLHIDEFVRKQNTIDVESEKSKPHKPLQTKGLHVKARPLSGTRVDYFVYHLGRLTPRRDLALPYQRGDILEVRVLRGHKRTLQVEVLGHDAPPKGVTPSVVSLRVRELLRPASGA